MGIGETLEKIRVAVPLVRSLAEEGERLGTLAPAVDQVLRDLKLLTLMLPRRWGGGESSFTDYVRIHLELAKGDLSACWIVYAANAACWQAGTSSDACQEALFGAGPKVVCGAARPPGRAREVDGGYIVDGAWPYASASRQADWGYGGAILTNRSGAKAPGQALLFFPMADIEIKKTWHVTGLVATASDTMVAKGLFVPFERVVPEGEFGSAKTTRTKFALSPLDRIHSGFGVRVSGFAQLVGGAQAMLDLVGSSPAARGLTASAALQDIAAQIDSARATIFELAEAIDAIGTGKAQLTLFERSRQKGQCGLISEIVHAAVERLMFVAGPSAFARSNPLSRYWRDIHMAMRHANHLSYSSYESSGIDRLGTWSAPVPNGVRQASTGVNK